MGDGRALRVQQGQEDVGSMRTETVDLLAGLLGQAAQDTLAAGGWSVQGQQGESGEGVASGAGVQGMWEHGQGVVSEVIRARGFQVGGMGSLGLQSTPQVRAKPHRAPTLS